MPEVITVTAIGDIAPGDSKIVEWEGKRIALFNVGGQLHAVDNACPHRGASLGAGEFSGTTVTCPLHHWDFDVTTGACGTPGGQSLVRYDVQEIAGELRLEPMDDTAEESAADDQIHRYLIRYGALGWVSWMGSIEHIECGHKDRVVVQTSRGVELGEVLSSPTDNQRSDVAQAGKPHGEVLRLAEAADLQRAESVKAPPEELLTTASQMLSERRLPVDVVDFERLLDETTVILYFLGEQFPEFEAVAEELSQRHQLTVRFFPLVEPPPQAGGCGEAGCGGGGCGSHAD